MIHARNDAPLLLSDRHSIAFSCPNESLLIPWRLASFIFHCMALIGVSDFRRSLVIRSLPFNFSESDFSIVSASADAAVALSVLCLAVTLAGIATAMTLREDAMNLMHAICHTTGGVLLVAVWYHTSHVARLWHIWYFFNLAPAIVEMIVILLKTRRGIEKW